MNADERTALEQIQRELDCLGAAMEATLRPGNDSDTLALEHYVNSVEYISEKLSVVAGQDGQ